MRTVIVIQARTGSSRLPGKVLLELGGKSLLERMLERVQASALADEVTIATTWLAEDAPIRELARRLGVRSSSGHPTDLLARHRQAAREANAEAVVKIPSDCPLIDAQIIDAVLAVTRAEWGRFDLFTNLHPPSWPDGNDVEVFSSDTLEVAWREARRPLEREHTTPFIWDQPERFRIRNVPCPDAVDYSRRYRLTLDYPEDYALIQAVFTALWRPDQPLFTMRQIIALLEAQPELAALNQRWLGNSWQARHRAELRNWRDSSNLELA
jgi:spore coat polysaccharide biosynthesis protein SpsF